VESESKTISRIFGVEPLLSKDASETALKQEAPQIKILHIAAHGKFEVEAPLNSIIALSADNVNDGWLTVGEVYGLDLKNSDLVVLSACETQKGKLSSGDELVGLTRAFIFAGTPSIVASLWTVDDRATSILMEYFYRHLQKGMGKADALRQAQLDLKQDYPNPYYWGAFVLSGDQGSTKSNISVNYMVLVLFFVGFMIWILLKIRATNTKRLVHRTTNKLKNE
jgi:CHAT domain-containing protein